MVRFLAPPLDGEDSTKGIDFSPVGIRQRRDPRYADTSHLLATALWSGEFDPIEDFILHEARPGPVIIAGWGRLQASIRVHAELGMSRWC